MTGSQYKNVAQWTLANTPGVEAMDSADAARAIFNNLGVAFPNGSCEEILLTLMSEDYMGWTPCTCRQAQEYANAGVAAVGVDTSRVVVILPDESADGVIASADAAVVSASAKQTSDISATERMGMQFYAYAASATTTVTPVDPPVKTWSDYANLVVSNAVAQLGKTYADFTESIRDGIVFNSGAWCVDFVRWCCKRAGVYQSDIIPETSSSTSMRNWYKNNQEDRLHTGSDGIQAGDIVFIASSTLDSSPYHTCIATSSKNSDGTVNTINGNWGVKDSNGNRIYQVAYQMVPVSGVVIGWYAHPDYELANS